MGKHKILPLSSSLLGAFEGSSIHHQRACLHAEVFRDDDDTALGPVLKRLRPKR